MPPGSPPRPRRTRRSAPWLLATLTLALALAGPAYADTLGTEGIPDPETVLASEVPELPEVPMEVPPDAIEPLTEPAEAPPVEPPAPVPEPAPLPEEPPLAEPAEDAVSLGAAGPAAELAEPAGTVEDTGLLEEPAGEPPAYSADEPEPPLTQEADTEEGAPPLVIPLNLNVDIRILSPGNDGDVSQVIDVGGPQGLGGGNPADMLGGLGMDDLGLDWSWNWNWNWDCGGASTAGLDWNWNWSWSGDCAGGLFDGEGLGSMPSLGEQLRGDRPGDFLDALDSDVIGLPPVLGGYGPTVATRGAGGSAPAHRDERDDASTAGAPAFPSGDGGFPALVPTTFASTRATTRSQAATAPARSPAGSAPNGDPERRPAGLPAHVMGLAAAAGGGGGGGAAFTVLLLAALVGALALVPPPPGERVRAVQKKLSSLLSSSRLERPG
jgi:hypothetical protein